MSLEIARPPAQAASPGLSGGVPSPACIPRALCGCSQPNLHPQSPPQGFPSPVVTDGGVIQLQPQTKQTKRIPYIQGLFSQNWFLKMEKTYFFKKSQSFYYSSSAPTSVSMLFLPTQTPQITPLRRGWCKVLVTRDDWVLGSCYTALGLFFSNTVL